MLVKIKISSDLEVLSGLHIGGNSAFAAIGAVDSTVIKDSVTLEPIIPGSSLKGKIRILLAKKYNEKKAKKPEEDDVRILNLFGMANTSNEKSIPSRLSFYDIYPINKQELLDKGVIGLTEVKFENNIDRLTAKANPRQIERVIRGTIFRFNVSYEYSKDSLDVDEIKNDLYILYDGIKLLEEDYLGGSGTRGYGRVKFSEFKSEILSCIDNEKPNIQNMLNDIFKG